MLKHKYLVSYIMVILMLSLVDNNIFVIILVTIIFLLFVYEINILKRQFTVDKKQSINILEYRLNKTVKKEGATQYRFFQLTEQMKSALIIINEDRIIEYVNPSFCDFFGTRNINGMDYTKTNINKTLKHILNDCYLLEKEISKVINIHNKYYDLSAIPYEEDSIFKGFILIAHDISAIKNMEKFQKDFIADVSHELRTPVSAIKAASELLIRDQDLDVQMRNEFITIIAKENFRMENMINDLMEISKLDKVNTSLNKTYVNLNEVIKYSVSLLEPLANEKDIELTFESNTDISSQLDEQRFKQVLINLIKNAINYTDEGYVKVKLYEEQNQTCIEITDTGIGMTQNDLNRIYERFYRVDRARSRDTGGTGLGLSIVKTIIDKHGAKIEVSSKENFGTTFKITL